MDAKRLTDAEIESTYLLASSCPDFRCVTIESSILLRLLAELREWREIYKSSVPVGGKLYAPPFKIEEDQ